MTNYKVVVEGSYRSESRTYHVEADSFFVPEIRHVVFENYSKRQVALFTGVLSVEAEKTEKPDGSTNLLLNDILQNLDNLKSYALWLMRGGTVMYSTHSLISDLSNIYSGTYQKKVFGDQRGT